jgi:hypothetical protein
MEEITKNPIEEINMEAFREEIAGLIVERQKYKTIEDLKDFRGIDLAKLNDLTEEDAAMWYKMKNYRKGIISRNDIIEYSTHVIASRNHTRDSFASAVGNKLQNIIGDEQIEEAKRKRPTTDEK